MDETEAMARKLCAADGKNPDHRKTGGYFEIFDGRAGGGNQANRRWVDTVSAPAWESYRHLAEAAVSPAPTPPE